MACKICYQEEGHAKWCHLGYVKPATRRRESYGRIPKKSREDALNKITSTLGGSNVAGNTRDLHGDSGLLQGASGMVSDVRPMPGRAPYKRRTG